MPEGSPPAYQTSLVGDVDYVFFESKLGHRNPQRGVVNRVYVQVHNRGIQDAQNVVVKLLSADATAGAPNLPPDFWTAFPGDPAGGLWTSIGAAQIIPVIKPTEPAILEWDWTPPMSIAQHSCLLVVIDNAADPIPPANKGFDIWALANAERHIGWKNVHVVNAVLGATFWTPLRFFGTADRLYSIRFSATTARGWQLGLLLPRVMPAGFTLRGMVRTQLSNPQRESLRRAVGDGIERLDTEALYQVRQPGRGGAIDRIVMGQEGITAMLMLAASSTANRSGTLSVVQELDGRDLMGGSTYVLNVMRG